MVYPWLDLGAFRTLRIPFYLVLWSKFHLSHFENHSKVLSTYGKHIRKGRSDSFCIVACVCGTPILNRFIMENEEILDRFGDGLKDVSAQYQKYRGWIIFVALLLLLIGILSLIGFVYNVKMSIARLEIFGNPNEKIQWLSVVLRHGLTAIFGACSLFGGVGLLAKKRLGWVFSLSGAVFVTVMPVLAFVLPLLNSNLRSANPGGVMWFLVALFVSISTFLIWKPIRQQFSPNSFSYLIFICLVFLQIGFFVWWPLTR